MRRAAIERLLPAMYQRAAVEGSVLGALLDVMETLHAPSEALLADLDDLFAPYRAPEALLPFLAHWVAWGHIAPSGADSTSQRGIPSGRLRDLVQQGAELARGRGTAAGLRTLLETVTGVPGFRLEEPPRRPFHAVVRVPAAARTQIDLIRRVVAAEKPAATTTDIVIDGTPPEGE